MADDLKVIELMGAFFAEQAKKTIVKDNEGKDVEDDALKKSVTFNLRKVLTAFTDWYDKTRKEKGWKTGDDPKLMTPIFKVLPKTTGDESLGEYEGKMIPILEEFNRAGKDSMYVWEYFDSYLERIKYGWKKRIEDLKQK